MKTINPTSLRKRIVTAASILPIIFALYFGGCKSNPAATDDDNNSDNSTPRTPVPAQLVGAWYSGTVSSVYIYDRATGSWNEGSGTGLSCEFLPDGRYRKSFLMRSSLYNCTMANFVYHEGTMTVEGNKIVLYPTYGRIRSMDTCVQEYNYEKPDALKQETILWELGTDEYGVETLWMRYPHTDYSAFHQR